MRLIVMATGPFAAPTLESLYASSHEVLALVTRPAKTAAGRRPAPASPVKTIAEPHASLILEPPSINDSETIERLKTLAADVFVVCDYGQILSPESLSAARLGGVNLHGSLLPRYRGAAPVHWAIYHGEATTGITVIHMTPRLDAGPSLVKRAVAIGPDETTPELEARLAELGVGAVGESLEMLAAWDGASSLGEVQDAALATRAPRLKKEDGWIDWRRTATEIKNQVRAFQPWPGAYSTWRRPDSAPVRLIFEKVRVVESATGAPGAVSRRDKDHLEIATGEGAIAIERLQPAGKRLMDVGEFLRGYPIVEGDVLTNDAGAAL